MDANNYTSARFYWRTYKVLAEARRIRGDLDGCRQYAKKALKIGRILVKARQHL